MTMTTLNDYLNLDGWSLLEPLPRDHGELLRAVKDDTTVHAATMLELTRRIWDIERGVVRKPTPVSYN